MQMMRERPQLAITKITRSGCTAVVFAIHAFDDRPAADVITRHQNRSNARFADSESRFLAIKKFSCSPASRLIGARQNRFFERIDCG
jgi:hypothetical protein